MVCKYCHEKSHYIDTCPVIICKICRDVGHPKWLCPKLSSGSNNGLKNSNNNYLPPNKTPSPSNNNFSSIKTYSSSLSFSSASANSSTNSHLNASRNLNYYIKMIDEPWTKFY